MNKVAITFVIHEHAAITLNCQIDRDSLNGVYMQQDLGGENNLGSALDSDFFFGGKRFLQGSAVLNRPLQPA